MDVDGYSELNHEDSKNTKEPEESRQDKMGRTCSWVASDLLFDGRQIAFRFLPTLCSFCLGILCAQIPSHPRPSALICGFNLSISLSTSAVSCSPNLGPKKDTDT